MPAQIKSGPSSSFDHISPSLHTAFPYCLIIAAVIFAYSNIIDNPFLFDDEFDIVNNALLRDWHSIMTAFTTSFTAGSGGKDLFYRPLQTLLYLFIYQIFGLDPAPFQCLGIILHTLNGCLVYSLGLRLRFKPLAVLAAALIWAMHPLFVEAIAYMSGTADPLYTAFSLLGLLVLFPAFSLRTYWLACPFYALAMLSKETGILFPLLALSCQYIASDKRLDPKNYLRAWPLAVAVAGYFALRYMAIGGDNNFWHQSNIYTDHVYVRFFTFLATLPAYAKLLVWPSCLHLQRDFPVFASFWNWPVIIGAGMFVAAFTQIIGCRGRRGLPLSWGLMWFGSAHLLNAGVFLPINALFLEHWMYMPTIGLFLGLAQSISLWIETSPPVMRVTAVGAALAAAGALGAKTYSQNIYWGDPVALYEQSIHCGTHSVNIYNNLANAYADRGKFEKSIEQMRIAISLDDSFPQTHHNLALALLHLPDGASHIDEAIKELQRATVLDPDFFQSFGMLANIYAYVGDKSKEAEYRTHAVALRQKLGIPANIYPQPPYPFPQNTYE